MQTGRSDQENINRKGIDAVYKLRNSGATDRCKKIKDKQGQVLQSQVAKARVRD